MHIIGLGGGIASGKSTLSAILAQRGAVIVSADLLAHDLYRPGTPIWQQVVDVFGERILNTKGGIDREKLGAIVFVDEQALKQLNQVVRAPLKQLVKERLADLERTGVEVAVLEAAVLIEAGWTDIVNEIWITAVSPPVATQRLIESRGLSQSEALSRIASQLSNEERMEQADVVINTDCSLSDTTDAANEAWDQLMERLGEE